MIRASEAEIRTWVADICPEESLYTYTPSGAVKQIDISPEAKEKVRLFLEKEMNIACMKNLARDLIEEIKESWTADGSQ